MQINLEATTSPEIARALVRARVDSGSPAMDMVLTALVVTDDETVGDALRTAATLSREHPSRVIGIVLGDGRGQPRVDATVRVGENAAGESILLRLSGPLTKHAESVVLPLLLPDSPVVVWWPGKPPTNPSADPIGRLAQRRLTDAEATDSPVRTLMATARHYAPGDTDLSWTRLTPWRALLAAALDQATGTVHRGVVEAGAGNPAARLLTGWLQCRLGVPVTERRSEGEQIARVVLETEAGDVSIERVDAESCLFSVPGARPRHVPLGPRTLAELLAEDLRRLDADEVYHETLTHLLES
jgi:glucose-6-phosphate dehydrogenase assembly protein OpcA